MSPSVLLPQLGAAATSPAAAPLTYRRFDDVDALRSAVFTSALDAARNLEPVSNTRHTLSLADVDYTGPETFSKRDQKKAILTGSSLARKLQGTLVLSDTASGKELARRNMTLAKIPYLTSHGTFILNGNDYTFANQLRLRPGIFTRQRESGDLESHVNVAKGYGHRLYLDPATGIFRVQLGQSRIPLLPLLRAMGVKDTQLKEAWGDDLLAANIRKDDPSAMRKFFSKLSRDADTGDDTSRAATVLKAFQEMTLDPEVTKRTLGKEYSNVTADTILDTTRKLLQVNRGEADSDDRDAMAYQKLMGPEDIFAERIRSGKAALRNVLWKASAKQHLDNVPTGPLQSAVQAALIASGLSQPIEEVNPIEIVDQLTRVTRLGKGGIESQDAVPDSSRAVQPTQYGFVDPIRTPESANTGIDLRLARAAVKGSDGRLYTRVRDVKTGELVYKSPQDLADSAVAFPNELKRNQPYVQALVSGRLDNVARDQVKYEVPNGEDVFNQLANLIPGKSTNKPHRVVMGSRMLTQAVALREPEAPLVQSATPDDPNQSFEELYGDKVGVLRAKTPGRVTAVAGDEITIRTADGKLEKHDLYNNYPLNRKSSYHQTPTVKPGDVVRPGDLLATSNFSDKNGTIALGRNANVAYAIWDGRNHEDAVVISESFAKKLTSEHMYPFDYEWDATTKPSKSAFVSSFPGQYDREMLSKIDNAGVVVPGTVVKQGDPLILAVRRKEGNAKTLLRGKSASFVDDTVTWDKTDPGEVIDVEHTPKGVALTIRAYHPARPGDKVSDRVGGKGVISAIVPDDQIFKDSQGRPFDIILNPGGLSSRTNAFQIHETALGKIAALTGKPYKLRDFSDIEDVGDWVSRELRKHGLSAKEAITDPRDGVTVPNITTGNRWFMKLSHMSEAKGQGRGLGEYTAEGSPAKGGYSGAKRVGGLELGALISHGAPAVISDIKMVRGQANPRVWQQYMAGFNPPTPKVPATYQKFVSQLKAAGMNPVREGTRTHIMALTPKAIDDLTEGRELANAETVNWESMEGVKGGLFDHALTGGHMTPEGGGNLWAAIKLHEPMPNPVMEEPIRKILGLTKNKFNDILAGKEKLGDLTGSKAIAKALDSIDLDKALEHARAEVKSGRKTRRDKAIQVFGYLKDAQRLNIHPRDWMWTKVPVLPPAFRPVSVMGQTKLPLIADANYLYRELWDANDNFKQAAEAFGDDVGEERLQTYNSLKAVVGLGEPTHPKNVERQVKGILKNVFGSSPKYGVVQRKLLGSQVDLVGRAVIAPDPDRDMDEVGLPENTAWDVYTPVIVRRLVRDGLSRHSAAAAVTQRSPIARKALLTELEDGVVIVNRAPTLHRYGMMAFRPKLVSGDTMMVNPITMKGFGADADGNCVVFDSRIHLELQHSFLYSTAGGNVALWREAFMRLIASQTVDVQRLDTTVNLAMKIGEFPRIGEPTKDRNGADMYAVPAGVAVRTFDIRTGRVFYAPVSQLTVEHDVACSRLETASGRSVEVSDNESLAVFDPATGGLVKTRPADAIGRLVPVARPAPYRFGDAYDFDTGWWYGALIADGWVTEKTVGYAKNDAAKRERFVKIAADKFNMPGNVYEYHFDKAADNKFAASSKVHINSTALVASVFPVYGRQRRDAAEIRGALIKTIPQELFDRGSEACLLGLLCGLLDGDAFVGYAANRARAKPQFSTGFFTSSPYLRDAICRLLTIFELEFAVGTYPAKANKHESYDIKVSTASMFKIAPRLQLVGESATAALRQLQASPPPWQQLKDTIPIPVSLAEEFASSLRQQGETTLYTAMRLAIKTGKTTRSTGRRIMALLPDVSDAAKHWQATVLDNNDVYWDTYKTVTPTMKQTVFDLAVDATKVFVTDGGLVVWDTMNFHVPLTAAARTEAAEKMLPSKNLFNVSRFKAHYLPQQEYQGALYHASARIARGKKPVVFATVADALSALRRNEITVDQEVEILKK